MLQLKDKSWSWPLKLQKNLDFSHEAWNWRVMNKAWQKQRA